MTVAALPASVTYAENGVTTSFAVPFRFKAAGDLIVSRIAAGVEAVLALGTDYTVTGGDTDAGGTVTRTVATNGASLKITRSTARVQPMQYTNGGVFPAKSHEEALDRQMLIGQEQDDQLTDVSSRALMLPPGESAPDLPPASQRLGGGKILAPNPDTGAIEVQPIDTAYQGPPGEADNSYSSLVAFRASDVTRKVASLVGVPGIPDARYYFERGAGPYVESLPDLIKADSTSLSVGVWRRQGATGISHTPAGIGAATRTAAQVMDEFVYASGFTGYTEAGEGSSTDSYPAIMAAIAVANARSRPLIIQGRPRISQTIKLTAPTHLKLEGSHYVPGQLLGGTLIIKGNSCAGPAIQVNPGALGSIIEGGGIVGESGNTGDGLAIMGARVIVRDVGIQYMGRDGIRIGGYATSDPWYDAALDTSVNANSTKLDNVNCGFNARDGLCIDDQKSGLIDANCADISRLSVYNNGRHGLYADKTYLGTTFTAGLFEGNTGYGIYLAANANGLVFIGGDTEANVAGQVYQTVPLANDFYGHSVQGVVWNTRNQRGSFTATIYGSTDAGAGVYTIRKGRYRINGECLQFEAIVTWTGHTGTGNMRFTLPQAFLPNSVLPSIPDFTPCTVLPNGGGLAVPSGAIITGAITATGQYGSIYYATAGGSGLTAFPMCAAGSLLISGYYELNPPIARL